MPQITAESIKRIARDTYDIEISDADAAAIANGAGAMLTMARHLSALNLTGIELPFGYPVLTAEAKRLRK